MTTTTGFYRVLSCPVAFCLVLLVLLTIQPALASHGDAVADLVFGQPDFFTGGCNTGGVSASSLCTPFGVAFDAQGNLYIADRSNNRVLEYDTPLTTDLVADRVFGQPDFFTSGCNSEGFVNVGSLCRPTRVAVDASGNLYVADSSNNRVLEFDNPLAPGSDTVADRVFGQPDFFTNSCNTGGRSASSLCASLSMDVAVDAAGNVYIADGGGANQRVLEYDTPLAPGSDTVADRVFGQPDFFTGGCNTGGRSASSLCNPVAVALDAAGDLYVAESVFTSSDPNDRVLEYDTPLAPGSDTVADRVFGKPDFFTGGFCPMDVVPLGASQLCAPRGVAVDRLGNLYVGDQQNRVLEYDSPLAVGGGNVADRVFGQPDFTSSIENNGGISATSLAMNTGLGLDQGGNLYVADSFINNRVLVYFYPVVPAPDSDGDGIVDLHDACPSQNASGLDADHNGCIDTLPGLRAIVVGLTIDKTTKNGLLAKLDEAQKALNHGDTRTAINKLMDFINQVQAKRGTSISNADADLLVAYANNVITQLR